VDQALTAEKGPGFDPTDSKFVNESDFFNASDIDDSTGAAFDGEDTPLAYVNEDTNDDLVINAAVDVGDSGTVNPTFPELIKISNDTTEDVDVGIAYDRNASQYGDDINGTAPLNYSFAQGVYEFQANSLTSGNTLNYAAGSGATISPDSTNSTQVSGTNNTINNNGDLPAAAATIPAGDALTIDLVVNISPSDRTDIENSVGGLTTFGSDRETVDIMDAITVGKFDTPNTL
jgi:hypothetical protein